MTFLKILVPSSLRVKQSKNNDLNCFTLEGKGTITVSHPTKSETLKRCHSNDACSATAVNSKIFIQDMDKENTFNNISFKCGRQTAGCSNEYVAEQGTVDHI
jgi:hypothetical protein